MSWSKTPSDSRAAGNLACDALTWAVAHGPEHRNPDDVAVETTTDPARAEIQTSRHSSAARARGAVTLRPHEIICGAFTYNPRRSIAHGRPSPTSSRLLVSSVTKLGIGTRKADAWGRESPRIHARPPPRGLEPLSESAQVSQPQGLTKKPDSVLASCLALSVQNDPDLAAVVETWADLPEAVRVGIVAMVKAAKR